MTVIALVDGALAVHVCPYGGALLDARFDGVPFLVSAGGPGDVMANFPLVPFGNRVEHNGFAIGEIQYRFLPNDRDPLYLHGDGWLKTWSIEEQTGSAVTLSLRHRPNAVSAYDYSARQTISLEGNRLTLSLSVTNEGEKPSLFGLGQHPFFVRTADTRLMTRAEGCWSERAGHLPDRCETVPADLDFSAAAPLPGRFVNNALSGWSGIAVIAWPERRVAADIKASPVHDVAMLYMPTDRSDFFCLEPMTHLPNGHHMPDRGGLKQLQRGEGMTSDITIAMRRL